MEERTTLLLQRNHFLFTLSPQFLAVCWENPLTVLSSAVRGGGLRQARCIVNRHVDRGYCEWNPKEEGRRWLERNRFDPEETVLVMTAAFMEDAVVSETTGDRFRLATIVTAGVGNAARAGKKGPTYDACPDPGTINILLVIDGEVTESAMVNAVITATEAKAAALQDLKVRDADGDIATGTTTDAIVVASTQEAVDGFVHCYAGVASPLGQTLGRSVYRAVTTAVLRERKKEGTTGRC